MKIALVMPRSTFLELPMVFPPLGLFYLAARLESLGHKTDFYDLNVDQFPADIYDQIWVSATSSQMAEVRRISKIAKTYRSYFIFGGAFAWANPGSTIGLNVLCVGGESDSPESIREILWYADLKGDGLISVSISKTLDWVIPPDRRWSHKYSSFLTDLYGAKIPATTMFTSRGCPYECVFCESGRLGEIWGSKVRYEPLDIVERQIKECKELGYGALCYYDDIMPLNQSRTLEIMRLHRKYNMIWRCFLRSDIICKRGGYDYLRELRDGGLVEVFIGVESASDAIKANVHKRTTITEDTNIVAWCKALGIRCKVSFILGLPGESMETMEETRRWILKNRPDRVQVGRLIPFPGTPLTKNLQDYDLMAERNVDEDWFYMGKNDFQHSFVSTSKVSAEQIDLFWHKLNRELEEKGISK